MSKEDYNIDGVNISKIFKQDKISWNWGRFNKLKERFKFKDIKEVRTNLVLFNYLGNMVYFGMAKGKIRLKGSNEWTTKHITFLKRIKPTDDYVEEEIMSDNEIIEKRHELFNLEGDVSDEKREIFIKLFPEMDEFKKENLSIYDRGYILVEYRLYSEELGGVLDFSQYMIDRYIDYLYELYPKTLKEIRAKDKKDKQKKYKISNKVGFGKHRKKTWLEALEIDRKYFIWLKNTTENKTLKSFIESII